MKLCPHLRQARTGPRADTRPSGRLGAQACRRRADARPACRGATIWSPRTAGRPPLLVRVHDAEEAVLAHAEDLSFFNSYVWLSDAPRRYHSNRVR